MSSTSYLDVYSYRRRVAISYLMVTTLLASVGIAGFILKEEVTAIFNIPNRTLVIILGVICIFAVSLFLTVYLRGDLSPEERSTFKYPKSSGWGGIVIQFNGKSEKLDKSLSLLKDEIAIIKVRLEEIPTTSLGTKSEINSIIESLKLHVDNNLASYIELNLDEKFKKTVYESSARETYTQAISRLKSEVQSLTRRGNVNLTIGVITTGIAVGLLAYMVLNVTETFTSWTHLLSHYIPRVATVVFIEVFSFFFLKLYRSSLNEIKYYQNELTRLDIQRISIDTASTLENQNTLHTILCTVAQSSNAKNLETITDDSLNPKDLKDILEAMEKIKKILPLPLSQKSA